MELVKRTLRVLAIFVLANLGLLELLCPLPGRCTGFCFWGFRPFMCGFMSARGVQKGRRGGCVP